MMSFLRRFFFFFLRMGNHHSNPDWTWKVLMECFNPSADSVVWALSPPFRRSVDDVNLRPRLRVYPTRKHARTQGVLSVTGLDTHTKIGESRNNCFLLFELPICRISLVKEEEGRKENCPYINKLDIKRRKWGRVKRGDSETKRRKLLKEKTGRGGGEFDQRNWIAFWNSRRLDRVERDDKKRKRERERGHLKLKEIHKYGGTPPTRLLPTVKRE